MEIFRESRKHRKIKILLSIKKTKVPSKSNKAAKLFFTQMIGN